MPDENGKLTQVEMEDLQKWATKTVIQRGNLGLSRSR